jgi:WD40 repeat-containing protein SMU1
VIRIILQFCKENGLHESFKTMQKETQIALNTVDAKDILIEDILNGR